jgi:DNA-binding transcriptional MerR regulator
MNKGSDSDQLLRIGELAKLTGEKTPTLNYWTTLGILKCSETTAKGYRLYSAEAVKAVKEVRRLQKVRRRTLEEIREQFNRQ